MVYVANINQKYVSNKPKKIKPENVAKYFMIYVFMCTIYIAIFYNFQHFQADSLFIALLLSVTY